MTGRHSYRQLRARMSPRARAKAQAEALRLRADMDLREVRRAQQMSQAEIAETLNVGQAAVAKLEQRTDMYVSTLRRFIEAMGGELDIVARFPGSTVRIQNFGDLSPPKS